MPKNPTRNYAYDYVRPRSSDPTAAIAAAIAVALEPSGDEIGTVVDSTFDLVVVTPDELTADADDWDGTGDAPLFLVRITSDAPRSISGIEAPADADASRAGILVNINAADDVTLLDDDAGSVAANRILCPDGTDVALAPNVAVWVAYDSESDRWRIVGGTGGGGSVDYDVPAISYGTPTEGVAATAIRTDATLEPPEAGVVPFDDTVATLSAADVQEAIDALAALMAGYGRTFDLNYIIDGGTLPPTVGVKQVVRIPFNCTIVAWRAYADVSGSIDVDVLRTTHANYAPGTHPVLADSIIGAGSDIVLSSASKAEDTTVDWDVLTLTEGDLVGFYVVSVTTIKRLTVALTLQSNAGGGFAATVEIPFVIDGGGSVIPTGIAGDMPVAFDCVITEWTLVGDVSGSIVVDIWKDTYGNYPPVVGDSITAAAKPTISAALKGQSSTLTGWTTQIAAGDTLRFNVDSASTVKRVTLVLKCTRLI